MKQYPSIFNDVIGPVMIGHSSSHTAASVRLGNLVRQLAGDSNVRKIKFSFDAKSSLAFTYKTQGSDIGLLAGLLGFAPDDKSMIAAHQYAREAGIDYSFEVKEIGQEHPNLYYIDFITLGGKSLSLTAISTGGGMIEITSYAGFEVSIDGGFFEALIECNSFEAALIIRKINETLNDRIQQDKHIMNVCEENGKALINVKSTEDLQINLMNLLLPSQTAPIHPEIPACSIEVNFIKPIMPVMSQIAPHVPFITASGIIEYAEGNSPHRPDRILEGNNPRQLWELALLYESERSGLTPDAVMRKMMSIVDTLKRSLEAPLNDEIKDRILPNQSHLIEINNNLPGGSFNKNVIKYVTKFMDIKTSMGVFVAAPTAGSCGCLGGTLFALAEDIGLADKDIAKAFLSAGLVGVIIARHSTFAAELCACQAECGAASGMCAAACAGVLGASAKVSLSAASMALQNIFGLVCDPVGNKVEVPCLGKNILAAFNAIANANMAVSGYDQVIPLDETIAVMDSVGRIMPRELKCTGLGGLSITKTSLEILKKS